MVKDINDFYFTNEDYDVFHKDKACLNTREVREQRCNVQDKLLAFNRDILYPKILQGGLNLATHKSAEHITSLAFPCKFNAYRVDWLGIRYGRNARDIEELQEVMRIGARDGLLSSEDKKYGFQKYACLQVNICYTGLEVGLFHSTPEDAVDRMYLTDHIDDMNVQEGIINELRKLKGYGYVWTISNNEFSHSFDIDAERPEDFINFYREHDRKGMWSMMLRHFPRYDERITEDKLVQTCYDIIEQLKPLYELVIWKRGGNE